MADERAFLNEPGVYVSNTRVVIHGTTYATANITSVRRHTVAPKKGCATLLILVAALSVVGGLIAATVDERSGGSGIVIVWIILLAIGILWFRSLRATHHVMLATAAGERSGFTSRDAAQADRVTAALADAIVHRG